MSDKSFGDCPSRNIVKNPLLSTAVTGLSIEDLTHNAVLVPVAANQGLITRSDHEIGTNTQTLMHADHEFTNIPSGDSNTNVFPPPTSIPAHPYTFDHHQTIHHDKNPEIPTSTVSKASAKSEDDFDVNEYFARLQGTRYVSAPINSNPDQNANLAATEENLEEINLNDDKNVEVQQSLTADIAQNFSQLPTVLPHVASAVFSSFSNMLNYKSREQTPDERTHVYQDVPFQSQSSGQSFPSGQNLAQDTPLMAEDVVKEVAPPPKEPPVCGAANFRITTKKKYAQIPGLSSGQNTETAQSIAFNPLTHNVPPYFVPTPVEEDIKNVPDPIGPKSQSSNKKVEQDQNRSEVYDIFSPVEDTNGKASSFQSNDSNIPKENKPPFSTERLPPPPSKQGYHRYIPVSDVPPPPMFGSHHGSQTGSSVLPPSVARRINPHHPVMKPHTVQPSFTDNIFVPTFDPTDTSSITPEQSSIPSFGDPLYQSSYGAQIFATNQPSSQALSREILTPLAPTNMPSIPPPEQFVVRPPPGFAASAPSTSVIAPPSKALSRLPPQPLTSPPSNIPPANISSPPMFPPTLPSNATLFAPPGVSVDSKLGARTEFTLPPSNSSSLPSAAASQTILCPESVQPPPIGFMNVSPPSSIGLPPASNITPQFYSPDNIKEQQSVPDQLFGSDPPKPMIEPPKSTGGSNFRMNKKRPQYYSGPIEGVGSISNSIKPTIESIGSRTFQGALFTPEQPQAEQNVPSSLPFDISKISEPTPLVPEHNVAKPSMVPPTAAPAIYQHYDFTSTVQYDEQPYNTAFDFSRPTTESFENKEEQKETKGFGIIGSLKSKLSSIDINKIQHSVTTFFDPAYTNTKKDDSITQENIPYSTMPYRAQGSQSNLEIFVPNVEQQTQTYDYQQHQHAIYLNNQYYKYPNFQNQGLPQAGHCSNFNHYPNRTHANWYGSNPEGSSEPATNASMFQTSATSVHSQGNVAERPEENIPNTDTQETSIGRNVNENVTNEQTTQIDQNVTSIEEKSAMNIFELESLYLQSSTKPEEHQNLKNFAATIDTVVSQDAQNRLFTGDSFDQIKDKIEEAKSDPISFFDANRVNAFSSMTIDTKEATNEETRDLFANKGFFDKDNISNIDLFANISTDKKKTEESRNKLFAAIPVDNKEQTQKLKEDIKIDNPRTSTIFDRKEKLIIKDSLLETLSKDEVPILGVSSVPLFGLSTITADKTKEFPQGHDLINTLSDRNSSMSFFDHPQKPEECVPKPKHMEVLDRNASFSFFENVDSPEDIDEAYDHDKYPDMSSQKTNPRFYKDIDIPNQEIKRESPTNEDIVLNKDQTVDISEKVTTDTGDDNENVSELSICETCREVNKPEDKEFEDQDVTNQLIENLTSRIQLSNPVEALLTESTLPEPANTEQVKLDAGQFDEISHITEETIETIQVQSATELLEDVDEIKSMNYGWANEDILKQDYNFNINPNAIGFFGDNSLFFDKASTNTDEIKHHDDLLTRQMSAPTAPPAEDEEEDDTKSDEGGVLDVHSIEQDANEDFPLFEEFVIEPSENDDDKKEEKSEEGDLDSFTNRVEKFKKMDSSELIEATRPLFFDLPPQPISMVSYFDTGNYAAETHYRNTNTMPSPSTISIPPGFEEEFRKRLALAKLREEKLRQEMKTVPETSTQTRPTVAVTYSSAQTIVPTYCTSLAQGAVGFNVEANITKLVDDQSDNSPVFPTASHAIPDSSKDTLDIDQDIKIPDFPAAPGSKLEDIKESILPKLPIAPIAKPEEKTESKLPDPKNFFSDNAPENPPESFSRLASYFSSPPKTEHPKSFFELSQSQNHYRHASSNEPNKYIDLMKDLTSVQNIAVSKDQSIRHVNYFTVEYDAPLPDFNKGDIHEKIELVDNDTDTIDLDGLVTNCRYCNKIFNTTFKVRTAMNEGSEAGTATPKMEPHKEAGRGSVTVNFDGLTIHEEPNEGVAGMTENRAATEYTPVKHHWFYRVDIEDKSIWRGFSLVDSRALETAYMNPELNEQTLVATDGGRYDVNVVGRLRLPVYWIDKPTNVRRCSWFYKGTTDARYVPYTEPVAEKLEEEYRHGVTTGEWHRRLVLPNGEVVVMHGPSVMVHFLHSDAFSTPPLFSFGKRVYRNPPKIRVSRDQPEKIDHLILLVHGAGEYKCQKEKNQSSSRPRVVRRGHDESEIEDTEPSSIDHLLLLCHGVGSACDMRFRSVEEVVEDFRSTSLQLVQSHYRNSYDQGIVSRVEVLPISWHATLHSGETGVDRRLSQITLDSIPRLRSFTNDTVLDVLFYTSPVFCQTILDTVCQELNRIYNLFVQRNPSFKGGVSLGGHSLGSVILYDLLCHQADISSDESKLQADKHYVGGPAGTGQPSVKYPILAFCPAALYALGSPIAIFECIRGVESLGASFSLPTCKNFFNIFHPYDPIAYRIEPLINPQLRDLKPFLIPHHKGRKRMHLELKDTMARVGADLKQKLLESLKSTWNKWKAQPPTDGQLEKVVEEEIEKEQLCDDNSEQLARESELSTPEMLGRLNGGRRVDYVLQEAPLEMINEYLFAMSSHVGYWESEDTMLLMLREIYSALGVQPDSTVPQQNMTVQRTRTKDETIVLNASEFPSTSHGAI